MLTTEEAKVAMRNGTRVFLWGEFWKITGLMFRLSNGRYTASAELLDETGYSATVPVAWLTLETEPRKEEVEESALEEGLCALEEEVASFLEVARAGHRTAQEKLHDVLRVLLVVDKYYLDAKRFSDLMGEEIAMGGSEEYGRIYGYEEERI